MERGRRRAFTLVEVMVTIGIIVFLVGMTMSAATALARGAEVRRTEDAMRLLDLAMEEWEIQAGRSLTWGAPAERHDVWSERAHVLILTEMLQQVQRNKSSAAILARIDPDLVHVYEASHRPSWLRRQEEVDQAAEFTGGFTVLDAWGTPIYATHPGGLFDPSVDAGVPDPDGTERTSNEIAYGIAKNRRVCFVSAGPDGVFGLRPEFPSLGGPALFEAMREAKVDNLYSYLPEVAY
jgi:type II secretory pathway pseudopilin PulG